MLKRDSSHYLGADLDYGKAHWTIIGDHLRFYLVVAYKQNPKTHSHVLIFGDVKDNRDNQLKTVLEGYLDSQIGNVGFTKIFEYPDYDLSDKGVLQLKSKGHNTSGIGWIVSNLSGDINYLHGSHDCGQHQYPSLIL